MSFDRSKVLESAQRYASRGQLDRAISEYRKVVQTDPGDVRTWLNLGDLHSRRGDQAEAIETYLKAAGQYEDQSLYRKALAVYKTILKLDPGRLDVQLRLGEMFHAEGLVSDALTTYETVAQAHAQSGDLHRSLQTMSKMVDIDPHSIPVRIKLAEALSRAGRLREAAAEFEMGGKLLLEQGRVDDYIKVAERLLFHRQTDTALARELAELYLERRDPKRALAKLQLCFKADPKSIPTLELLAEAFIQLQQLPKTISVYKEIARIHDEARRPDERARVLKRILELDPGDAEARRALASFAPSSSSARRNLAPPPTAVVEPGPPVAQRADSDGPELIDEGPVEGSLDPREYDDEPAAPSGAPGGRVPSVPADVQREAQVARLLTECDVYLRYGLRQKVGEQLRSVLEIDPSHVEAHERLKDLYLEDGDVPRAVAELMTLAALLADDQSPAAVLYLRQVLDLEPGHEGARARLRDLGSLPPDEPDAASGAPAITSGAPAIASGAPPMAAGPSSEPPYLILEEEEVAPSVLPRGTASGAGPMPGSQAPESLVDRPAPSGAFGMPQPPGSKAPSRRMLPTPDVSADAAGLARDSSFPVPGFDPLAPMTPEEFEEAPLRRSSPGEAKAEAEARIQSPGEVEEMLDEADFYVTQGLFEEAQGTLAEALGSHPGHPLILDKLEELREMAQDAAEELRSGAPEANGDAVDHSFLLAEKLAEEFEDVAEESGNGSDVLDVDAVFQQFKRGVEQQVGAEDTDTHFDLGIAYKEMGLVDDAIQEFQLCLSDPLRQCIAETMIGLCYLEKHEIPTGIAHFQRGLEATRRTEREELGLLFELGAAYEQLNDPRQALAYFEQVHRRERSFRDVEARLERLRRAAASVRPVAAMGQDDIDKAFDDLMGED